MRPLIAPALVLLALAAPAAAQTSMPGAREYAEAIVELGEPRWEGQQVDWPEHRPRPAAAYSLDSVLWPVTVHADPGVPVARAEQALRALEAARSLMGAAGWPAPYPDGGLGRTAGFDLYLTDAPDGADAFSDGPVPWEYFDAVSSFAVVDPRISRGALDACVTSAYAQAALLGQAPAEARAWRQAAGAYLAWLVTGRLGCEGGVVGQQRHPWLSWIADTRPDVRDPSGGGLLLALLSARHDGATGEFVQAMWQAARQRSTGTILLRGHPDLWEVLEALIEAAGGDLNGTMEDLAVQRFFAGEREGPSTPGVLRGLGPAATVPVAYRARWEQLPRRTPPHDPPLEPFGSTYALVDVSEAPDDGVLRVWLRGEYGLKWSLVAIRLDALGRELQRVNTPPRKIPRSYVPVQLDEETEQVLVVVTNLSSRLPDADIPDENVRSFRLILDRGDAASALGPAP